MPVYEYRTDDGEIIAEFMSVHEKQLRENGDGTITLVDGRIARRHFSPVGVPSTKWGYWSDGLGTHRQDAPNLRRQLCDAGISARVNNSGQVFVESRQHRRQIMRARGLRDNDAGYGD